MIGALPPQPTIVETLTLRQELPDDIRRQQDFMLGLFSITGAFEGLEDMQNQTMQQLMHSNPMQGGAYE
jgi:hypothetical protein